MLEASFKEEELWNAINECEPNKALRPDGFNLNFYKKFFWLIKGDLMKALEWFHTQNEISKGCNASFFTLIPKVIDPISLGEYRPISFIESYYKIIAKILAKRLQRVISKIIGYEQRAFMKGRYILDSVFVANEMVDYMKSQKRRCLMFKANFKKAFDRINWEFLFTVLDCMGFGKKWILWIKACLSSASISILVNGSPTNEFSLKRGVRQGDPISPYLFIIAVEGLKVNLSKSCLYGVGIQKSHVEELASYLGCNAAKSLSFGGRLTLIKSVLTSLPLYAFSLLRVPSNVINILEGLRRKFFWGGSGDNSKISWVNWNNILLPYESGRLNNESLKAKNLALLGKWWWRFLIEPSALWVKVIKSIHGRDRGFGLFSSNHNLIKSSTWSNIRKIGHEINNLDIQFTTSFVKTINKGESTLFWKDIWIGNQALRERFKRLFKLEKNEDASFPIGSNDIDSWRYNSNGNGLFSTSLLTQQIDEKLLPDVQIPNATARNNFLPQKFEIFVGLLCSSNCMMHRLATKDNLVLKGVLLPNLSCVWCEVNPETEFHVFAACAISRQIWANIGSWIGIVIPTWNSMDDMWYWFNSLPIHGNKRYKKARINWSVWLQNPLDTIVELDKRGIDLDSLLCPVCNNEVETIEHTLLHCSFARDLWDRVLRWWKIGPGLYQNLDHMFLGQKPMAPSPTFSKLRQCI
ncbi:uncharacterized protein [Rutidosis leptorrhynchoides]|uniref:uncharacterized protein n=1 Tax=Rutidosis leptorrhynchoides TaxID=125765 RepID=UPI003A99D638